MKAETDSIVGPAREVSAAPVAGVDLRPRRLGLSGRLFLVTVAFVVVAEILTFVPAVANYRIEWMDDRLAAAQVAALVLDGRTAEPVSEDLESRLLQGVNARAIVVRGSGAQRLLAIEPIPERVADTVDLGQVTTWSALRGRGAPWSRRSRSRFASSARASPASGGWRSSSTRRPCARR